MGTSSASNRSRITASCAATLMPWPKTGLKRQRASPVASSPAGNDSSALEMSPYAARQLVADDIRQRPRVPDRVMDGRGAQALDEIHESRAVARRRIAVIAADGKQPSLLLDRKQERPAAAGRCGRQHDIAQPVAIVIGRPLDDGARIGLIDADLGFFRLRQRKLFEQLAASGRSGRRLRPPGRLPGSQQHHLRVSYRTASTRIGIARCDKPGHAGAHADLDVRGLLNAPPRNGFEQWARHAENVRSRDREPGMDRSRGARTAYPVRCGFSRRPLPPDRSQIPETGSAGPAVRLRAACGHAGIAVSRFAAPPPRASTSRSITVTFPKCLEIA